MLACSSHCLHPPLEIQNYPKPLSREIRTREARKMAKGLKSVSEFNNKSKPSSLFNPYSYFQQLQSCSGEKILRGNLQLHAHLIKTHLQSDHFLQTNLLNLYIGCGRLDFAWRVFQTSNLRTNLISLNSIITTYCRFGFVEEALSIFIELQESGLAPDQFTLSVLIGAMEAQGEVSLGIQFHSLAIKFGYGVEEYVANSLIQMYAAFGRIDDSHHVFEGILDSASVVSWNSMISQFTENELYVDGLDLYEDMQHAGTAPTPQTLSSVLKACTALRAISEGKQVHAQAIVHGFLPNVILESILVDFCSKCGELENGKVLFDQMEKRNVFTWNSMIRGYSQLGYCKEALQLFGRMRREEIAPDKFTYTALLSGVDSGQEGDNFVKQFNSVHANIIKVGLQTDRFIGTSLISMYSRNQSLDEARLAFCDTNSEDSGVWSSIISASVKNKEGQEALSLFSKMLQLNIEHNPYIFSSLFTACCDLSAIEGGKQIHGYCLKNMISCMDTMVQNSLMTMYSDSGLLTEARRVFNSITDPNVASFNSMISALAQHGLPDEAFKIFRRMANSGTKPDDITLLNLLSALNHAGLVDEGLELFDSMEKTYKIKPRYQHSACVVDMLARAGEIDRAIGFMDEMPFEPEPSLWRVLLGGCRKHQNIRTGRRIAEQLIKSEPYEATNYVLIANVYARLGYWAEAERIRNFMEERCIKKEEGVSWIEVKRRIHKFRVEDKSHPQSKEIYDKLGELMKGIKAAGYKHDVSFTLHDMEDERREESLWYHAEKLAFAFGVICTGKEVKLRIMQNLRVCGDCHCAFKYFSLITGREIILRDKYRFHHFSGGVCSCRDYW